MAPKISNLPPMARRSTQTPTRNDDQHTRSNKIVLMGPPGVGKTWTIRHLSASNPTIHIPSTIEGVEVYSMTIANYHYTLWEIDNLALSTSEAPRYCEDAGLAIIMVRHEEEIDRYQELLHQFSDCPYLVVIRSPVPDGDTPPEYVYLPYNQGHDQDILGIGDLGEAIIGLTVPVS